VGLKDLCSLTLFKSSKSKVSSETQGKHLAVNANKTKQNKTKQNTKKKKKKKNNPQSNNRQTTAWIDNSLSKRKEQKLREERLDQGKTET
jgi:hypothetical protein